MPSDPFARALSTALLSAVGLVFGCGGEAAPTPRPSLLESVTVATTYSSPARWIYHPKSEAKLLARAELDDGRALLVGARGERWLVDPKTGRAQAAARLAPEDLIAIQRGGDGGFVFVGRSGASYSASDPLAPFSRSTAPVETLVDVEASDAAILAVRLDGALVRSADGGASWSGVGPEATTLADVALEGRRGLALAVPERLWQTVDAGASWRPVDEPTLGARSVSGDGAGRLVVDTILGPREWTQGGRLATTSTGAGPPRHTLAAEIPLGPSAAALHEGRATILAGRYLEVRRVKKKWRRVSGPADGVLQSAAFPTADACAQVSLGGYQDDVVLACFGHSGEAAQPIRLFRSSDRGKSFSADPLGIVGSARRFRMAVGREGALLLSGVCPASTSDEGCRAVGVHHLRTEQGDAGRVVELSPSSTPALEGVALAAAFSLDGRGSVALARRSKGGGLAAFVSRDGGRFFRPRNVEAFAVAAGSPKRVNEKTLGVDSVAVGEDGSTAFVLTRRGNQTLLVVDDSGHVLSVSVGPVPGVRLGGVGARALAVDVAQRRVWESMDGGATWEAAGSLPLDVCPEHPGCALPIQCHLAGCVVGDSLSRIGWRGQSDESEGLLAPRDGFDRRFSEPRVREPLTCTPSQINWASLPAGSLTPSADQAGFAETAWFSPSEDRSRGSAAVSHASSGDRPVVRQVSVLDPVRDPEAYAMVSSLQVEGVAALRYRVPKSGSRGAALSDVEVAWDNLLVGRVARGIVRGAGPYRPGDFVTDMKGVHRAQPDLLSIGAGGVYVRPHFALAARQTTFFVDGRRVETIEPVPWPAPSLDGTRGEMARVDGVHVPLRVGPSALVRAHAEAKGWRFDAVAVGFRNPQNFGREQHIDIAYAGARAGLHVTVASLRGGRAESWLAPFRADGAVLDPPVVVPTQLALGEQMRPCSKFQRDRTPRVVAPYQPGTRRPVLIAEGSEPLVVLLSGGAVLHGTADAPCAVAFDAHAVPRRGRPTPRHSAIIPVDDLEHAWLFRTTKGKRGSGSVQFRMMTCRLDPKAEVPAEVFDSRGTVVY